MVPDSSGSNHYWWRYYWSNLLFIFSDSSVYKNSVMHALSELSGCLCLSVILYMKITSVGLPSSQVDAGQLRLHPGTNIFSLGPCRQKLLAKPCATFFLVGGGVEIGSVAWVPALFTHTARRPSGYPASSAYNFLPSYHISHIYTSFDSPESGLSNGTRLVEIQSVLGYILLI